MPNKTSRRKRKEPSLAEQIVALCDEMLRLGREPGGEYKYGALRRGVMRGAQWETLAVELDGVAQRIANLVKSLDPAYDTTTFYSPAPVSVHKAYPQARKELSEEGRFWLQEDWLRGEGAEAVQDADDLLNQDRADMDPDAFDLPDDEPAEPDLYAIQEVRTRMQRTKMQWPGYVVELCPTRSGLRPYRLFYSPPAFLHAFDERFNALKTWAAERARQAGDGKARGGKAEAEAAAVVGGTWKRLRIAFVLVLLIVPVLLVGSGAWYWGEGDNLWQKCLKSWPFFAPLPGFWAIALRVILGRAFWQHFKIWKGDA